MDKNIKSTNLIQVHAIKKKYLDQVQLIPVALNEWREGLSRILNLELVVRFWFPYENTGKWWLCEDASTGKLFRICIPNLKEWEGVSDIAAQTVGKVGEVPQLFID